MFGKDLGVSQLSYLGLYVFLYIAVGFQTVSNMEGDLHIWEYNTLIWWRLWRKSERASCIFSTAPRWEEKSVYREICRKSARESKGDQTFQMILTNYLVYSNGCCYRRAKLRYYRVCSDFSSIFPSVTLGFQKLASIYFIETWEKLYRKRLFAVSSHLCAL